VVKLSQKFEILKNKREQPWFIRHPQRAKEIMKTFGMKTPFDEVKCPRCGQIIKPKGELLDAKHSVRYTKHLGSIKCRMQERHGRILNYSEYCALLMKEKSLNGPFCLCGCGRRTKSNRQRYATRACAKRHAQLLRIEEFVDKIRNGELQVELRKRLKIDLKKTSQMLISAEKLGLIKRERVTYRGHFTNKIIKVAPKSPVT
jgi:hypothetical protein